MPSAACETYDCAAQGIMQAQAIPQGRAGSSGAK